MPDNSNQCPVYEICKVCATLKHQSSGPFPSSHEDVCCGLSTLPRSSSLTATLDDQASHRSGHGCCDLVCKTCPLRCKTQACGSTSEVPEAAPLRRSNVQNTGIRHRQGHKNPTLEIRPPRFKKKLWFGTYKQPGDVLIARDAALYYMGFLNDLKFPDSQARFSKLHLGIQFGDLDPECTAVVNVGGKNVKKHTYFAKEVKRVVRIVLSEKDKSSPELLLPQQQQPPQTPDSSSTWGSHPLSEAIDPDVCLIDPSSIRPIYTTSPSPQWQLTDTICDSSPTFSEDMASSSLPHNSSHNSLPIASPTQDVSSSVDGIYGLVQLITPNSHCNITSAVTSEAVFPNDNTPVDWALQEIYHPNFDSLFLNPNFGIPFLPDSDVPCDFGGGGLIGPMLGDHCDMSDEEWRYTQSYLFPL